MFVFNVPNHVKILFSQNSDEYFIQFSCWCNLIYLQQWELNIKSLDVIIHDSDNRSCAVRTWARGLSAAIAKWCLVKSMFIVGLTYSVQLYSLSPSRNKYLAHTHTCLDYILKSYNNWAKMSKFILEITNCKISCISVIAIYHTLPFPWSTLTLMYFIVT